MKKSASPGQEGVRRPRPGRVGRVSTPTVEGTAVKLTPARKGKPAASLKEQFTDSEVCVVSFAFFSPTAREVLVAGSFNDWQPDATPMSKQHGGRWGTEILLQPGCYEYRFVVDGQWQDDPMAGRFVANSFGGLNCVVEVKSAASPVTGQP